MSAFRLEDSFIRRYLDNPQFGFGELGLITFLRTYSRMRQDGRKECWVDTVRRVVEGTYRLQKDWVEKHLLGYWDGGKATRSAENMFDCIYNMKFTPPGRGLWAMGSSIIERGLSGALFNCAFLSTKPKIGNPAYPFYTMADALMLGCGVGFDTKASGQAVYIPRDEKSVFVIPDSREGWVESFKLLINSYLLPDKETITFDYSKIRPAGSPIRGFGGVASGPEALRLSHISIRAVLNRRTNGGGSKLSITDVVDIMNLIGKGIVSGNIRRSAQICLGDESEEYLGLKNYDENPHRAAHGWASNNSVLASVGQDYEDLAERIISNGEPGVIWLENARDRSRMIDPPDYRDSGVMGVNPCSEQTLFDNEFCCLVEVHLMRLRGKEDFLRTLKYAYLYGKTVTLLSTHWPQTNAVMWKNRRIGCSLTGVVQFIGKYGLDTLRDWCVDGYRRLKEYDREYSDWYGIPLSIKITSSKPSGTVSLLSGSTPGVHFPHSRFCIRRIRLASNSELVEPLLEAGYPIEPATEDSNTVVVSMPIDFGEGVRSIYEVSVWEQTMLAAFMQFYWSDNSVSFTGSFDPGKESSEIVPVLQYCQYALKGVSFLPRVEEGAYPQMPYEAISGEDYSKMASSLSRMRFNYENLGDAELERGCTGDSCSLETE